jgi:hypothetical protein
LFDVCFFVVTTCLEPLLDAVTATPAAPRATVYGSTIVTILLVAEGESTKTEKRVFGITVAVLTPPFFLILRADDPP